jgi:DNA invertase Pin-like site-specific DNA recombinase
MELIAYARRSSAKQAENTSENTQFDRIEQYCQMNGYSVRPIMRDKEDTPARNKVGDGEIASGTLYTRQKLWEAVRLLICKTCPAGIVPKKEDDMKAQVLQGCACQSPVGYDGIIVYDLDRLGRDARLLLWLVYDVFDKRGKHLIVTSGLSKVDTTTPEGRFIFGLMANVAQFNRDKLVKNLVTGVVHKARSKNEKNQHGYVGGRVPYGYRTEKRDLVPHEGEQTVLKRANYFKSLKLTNSDIAKLLNAEGYRNRSGGMFTYVYVRNVLLIQRSQLRKWDTAGRGYNPYNFTDKALKWLA